MACKRLVPAVISAVRPAGRMVSVLMGFFSSVVLGGGIGW
jgi:hypothetical protein